MGYALKSKIQELKDKKVKYSFITPITDYINKEYKEIKEEILLDVDCLKEIIAEIQEKDAILFVSQGELFNVPLQEGNRKLYISIKNLNKEDKEKIINIEICGKNSLLHSWAPSYTITLNELYYVNDYDSYSDYFLNDLKKREVKNIEKIKEDAIKEATEISTLFTDAKRFGLNIDNITLINKYRKVEKIVGKDVDLKEAVSTLNNEVTYNNCTW